MTRIVAATRERFLLAIAAQVPPERIAQIHFFQGITQGGVESGVAVVAAALADSPVVPAEPSTLESSEDTPAEEESPYADDPLDPSSQALEAPPLPPVSRFTVLTAHYRLTLKGPDRGKWEASVVEEADAPLITVETVVRGVQRRSGDVDDPERMDGDEVREILGAVAARS